MEFKKGDWVVCNYEVQQVCKVADYTEVSNGYTRRSGLSITMFPLTLRNLGFCDAVKSCYKEIKQNENRLNLNWPDINRKLCDFFNEFCSVPETGSIIEDKNPSKEEIEKISEINKRMKSFCDRVIEKCKGFNSEYVDDVSIFRH